jgi:hypothetical protein
MREQPYAYAKLWWLAHLAEEELAGKAGATPDGPLMVEVRTWSGQQTNKARDRGEELRQMVGP